MGCVTEEHSGNIPPWTVYHPDWEEEESEAPQFLGIESLKHPSWGSPMRGVTGVLSCATYKLGGFTVVDVCDKLCFIKCSLLL